jgi:hypothetical protein
MMSRALAFAAACAIGASASAQTLPAEPISLGDGRVILGGDASVSIAPGDTGFFNYSDYDHSTLREFRAGLSAQVRATSRIALLADIRSENLDVPEPYALYARIKPFEHRRLDVQIGRIPPTVGRFARRAYGRDNPLIGYPLAYQYLTSIRADALPQDVDELLGMRGRGWLSNFTIGNTAAEHGVPLITAFRWDTGVQVTTGWKGLEVTGALTNGTASRPRVSDDNDGKQMATRLVLNVSPAFSVGSSFARGAFVSRRALTALSLPADAHFVQQLHGVDAAWERGHLLVRGEAIASAWDIPLIAAVSLDGSRTASTLRLKAAALSVEGKYAFLPGAYAAARLERLTFNRVRGATAVGRAGQSDRSRWRLLPAAQPDRPPVVAGQYARWGPRQARGPRVRPAPVLVLR